MVKFVVMYGQPEDPAAFDLHYAATHVPLVQKIQNLRRFEAGGCWERRKAARR
jgi:uncharacterized protein (TIGR02118 family)